MKIQLVGSIYSMFEYKEIDQMWENGIALASFS